MTNERTETHACDLISRQAAIDALCDNCNNVQAVCAHYPCKQYIAVEKLLSSQHKPLKYTGESICLYCQTINCDGCMYEPMKGAQ